MAGFDLAGGMERAGSRRGRARRSAAVLAVSAFLAACGSNASVPTTTVPDTSAAASTASTAATVEPRPPKTIHVPGDAATIQAAVDQTVPGDLVLIAAGTYNEAVTVHTPGVVVRGASRNGVILDGRDKDENGITVAAAGVAVENLTLKRYIVNGLLFTKAYDSPNPADPIILKGYRASYVTAYNNGLYGIYAFFADGGVIEHSYASGHPDSGIYVGQCKPCDAVVRDVTAERNAIGYEGTNAGGNLFVINSVWRNNRVGMTPNSQDQEKLTPQADVVIAGNIVEDNNDTSAPSTAEGAQGFGIAIAGGTRNRIVRNLVRRNASVGIAVTDLNAYEPAGNEVSQNVLEGNGTDLAFFDSRGSVSLPSRSNCFSNNTFTISKPVDIETSMGCPGSDRNVDNTGAVAVQKPAPNVDYRKVAAPPAQPEMPNAANAPAVPASPAPPAIDLAAVTLPKGPS